MEKKCKTRAEAQTKIMKALMIRDVSREMKSNKLVGIKTDLVKAPMMRVVSREVNCKTLAELETDHA